MTAAERKAQTARENGKKGAAKLRKRIDPDQVEKLAAMHCTHAEIAAVVGCSQDTVERRFADVIRKGRESGKAKLRHLQWRSAQNGNVTMQIWLGKQLLKQSDKQELTGADGAPLHQNAGVMLLPSGADLAEWQQRAEEQHKDG